MWHLHRIFSKVLYVGAIGATIFVILSFLRSGPWVKEIGIKMDKTQLLRLLNECKYSASWVCGESEDRRVPSRFLAWLT